MSEPTCASVVLDVLLDIRFNGLNETAARAAVQYLETRLAPVRGEMKRQLEGIPVVIAVFILLLIFIPLLIYLLWIAYELNLSVGLTSALILIFIVAVVISVAYTLSSISTAVDTVVEAVTAQFVRIDNPQAKAATVVAFNNSARKYLSVLNISC